ncbi:MAG: DUF4864 domain-containing protein [Pseudomonadota bacterium]
MRNLLLAAMMAAGAAQADEGAIQGVIGSQIGAFLEDDFAEAFTFAAPSIQGMFGTPERFGQMVRQGYPMVWRPGSVEYLGTDQIGGRWLQEVLVTDGDGRLHLLEYSMVETENGWKIAGVRILDAPEIGA